jgi:hypothetical protein
MHNRPGAVEELAFFRTMPSLELAIHHAGFAIDPRDKRFSHQRRIPRAALRKATALLSKNVVQVKNCNSFHYLHLFLWSLLKPIHRIGELYVYDTALRLGAFLGLTPKRVYLHAGTRTGARALGLDVSTGFLKVADFPKAIQSLAPHEIEDLLCIYKAQLTALKKQVKYRR